MIEPLTLCNMTSATTLSWRDSGTLPFFKTVHILIYVDKSKCYFDQSRGRIFKTSCMLKLYH